MTSQVFNGNELGHGRRLDDRAVGVRHSLGSKTSPGPDDTHLAQELEQLFRACDSHNIGDVGQRLPPRHCAVLRGGSIPRKHVVRALLVTLAPPATAPTPLQPVGQARR